MTADDKAREIAYKQYGCTSFCGADVDCLCEPLRMSIDAALEAARAEALEEAAMIAEGIWRDERGEHTAAAIRARKAEKETTTSNLIVPRSLVERSRHLIAALLSSGYHRVASEEALRKLDALLNNPKVNP